MIRRGCSTKPTLIKNSITSDAKVKERLAELEDIILQFNKWRRISRNQTTLLIGASMVAGGIGFGGFGYWYTQRNPEAIAVMVTGTARQAFQVRRAPVRRSILLYVCMFTTCRCLVFPPNVSQYAENYQTRKRVYFSLPEPDVPLSMLEVSTPSYTRF